MPNSVSWQTIGRSRTIVARRDRSSAASRPPGIVTTLVTAAALLVGAVLAVIFAATLAVVMALATALLGLSALVWRVRRRSQLQPVRIASRPAGHSWVTYSWDGR